MADRIGDGGNCDRNRGRRYRWGTVPVSVTGEQIGFGDAFLIFIMGLYCNVTELINVCMFALILVGIVSLFLMTVAKKSKKYELPFIPFVFLGRMVWLFCV